MADLKVPLSLGDKLDEVCLVSSAPGVDIRQHRCIHNPKVGYVN
jgi:hypothetical protein